MWDSERSLLWENPCYLIILQLLGHPPRAMGLDFILNLPLIPISCGFFFMSLLVKDHFQWVPIFFIDTYSDNSYDFW